MTPSLLEKAKIYAARGWCILPMRADKVRRHQDVQAVSLGTPDNGHHSAVVFFIES